MSKPKEFLHQLESISQLLDQNDDIPILEESIDDEHSNQVTIDDIRNSTTPPLKKHKIPAPVLPSATKKASGNNPFLPDHIRNRRGENKDQLLEEQVNQPGNPYEKVIDEIVRFYLPRMEADLRKRLEKITTSVLQPNSTKSFDRNK